MTESAIDYKQLEENILCEIKSLKRDETPKFFDVLEEKYIKLYQVRCIMLNTEFNKLPRKSNELKSIQEEYNCCIQYFNYYQQYNTLLVSHPIFYDFGKISEKRKIVSEINMINTKIQFLMNEITRLDKKISTL